MNFSGISNQSVLGKLLRTPLKLIPHQAKVPILQGKLRGKQWIVGSGQHGCWLGSYEYEKQLLLEKVVSQGNVVFDLGAHVGFHTLLASVLVGSTGRVFAFEPMPQNLHYLKEHLRLNSANNVKVIEAAVCDRTGMAAFELHSSSFQGHLAAQGKLQVRTVSLDELIANGETPEPDVLKIDVEGAEMQVFRGARSMLERKHPTILLATHGEAVHQQSCEFLNELGYKLEPLNAERLEQADEILAYAKG